ncbi:MAG: chromate resistance protein [Rhodanobacteraceae bacterium]|nr:chromate resistance protein [Rhodanobacteraceae bacterium]
MLASTEEAHEDFAWLVRQIRSGGAEVTLWCSRIVDGLSNAKLIACFQEKAQAGYEVPEGEVRAVAEQLAGSNAAPADGRRLLARLRNRFREIERRDFFSPARCEVASALLDQLTSELQQKEEGQAVKSADKRESRTHYQVRVWVTRAIVKADRMACIGLIRRFIDAQATFRFVLGSDRVLPENVLRFDMYEGEIIHDIDLKDERYQHPETDSLAVALSGISARLDSDFTRIEVASGVFDGLLQQFASK